MALLPTASQRVRALMPSTPLNLNFDILHRGKPVGFHQVSMRREGARMNIQTRVEAVVKVAFFTAFQYHHESDELWDSKGLLTLNTGGQHGSDWAQTCTVVVGRCWTMHQCHGS